VRAPALLALLAVLGLAAAGCSGKGTGTAAPPTASATQGPSASQTPTGGIIVHPIAIPPNPSITIRGCTNFGGVFPAPMAAAQALLPDGFTPLPAAGDPQGGATLYVLVLTCDDAAIDGTSIGRGLLAYEELAVVPDAAHTVKGITDYTVPLLFSAAPDSLAGAFEALHLGKAGGVSFAVHASGTLEAHGSVGADGFSLTGQPIQAPPTALGPGAFVVFGVRDRQVVSAVNSTSAGGSALQAPVILQAEGDPPLIAQARPATRGFTVSGFTLHYAPQVQ
jgi:hypothetical protein